MTAGPAAMVFAGAALRKAARLFEPTLRNLECSQPRLRVFAIIAIVAFPLYYHVWHSVLPQPYENLGLRLFGASLFVPIVFCDRWPGFLRRFLPYYWHLSLLYSLPFFFTFMLLKNDGSAAWLASALVALFVMTLLLDWVTLIAHFILGVSLAAGAFVLTSSAELLTFHRGQYVAIAAFAVAIGGVANYHRERIRIEQERAMLATAGSIAHELRTPLLGIRAGASGMAKYLPTLIHGYRLAQENGLPVATIRAAHLDALDGVLKRIDSEARHSNTVIDMLLVNARLSGSAAAQELAECSISRCIEMALDRYPFSEQERALVFWTKGEDFSFRGVELLTIHLLFNLIKNALRHIAEAEKGAIFIRTRASPAWNELVFRDTGCGISPEALPRIFMRFYTSSNGSDSELGSGIGLAFCQDVMQAYGGGIECASSCGEFSEFTLRFPAI